VIAAALPSLKVSSDDTVIAIAATE
jgi:hypothetical protein